MKKYLLFSLLTILISININSQDIIKPCIKYENFNINEMTYCIHNTYDSTTFKYINPYGTGYLYIKEPNYNKILQSDTILIPTYIFNDYKIGYNCINAGIATISIGSTLSIVGIFMTYAQPKDYYNVNVTKAGTAFMGIGGTLVSVSIPLFCFGDNMKRSCNREYKMYKSFK